LNNQFSSSLLPSVQAAHAASTPEAAFPSGQDRQLPVTFVSPLGHPAQMTALLLVQSLPVAAGRPSEHVQTLFLQLDFPSSFWYLAVPHDLHVTES